jgi:hypothetical protein
VIDEDPRGLFKGTHPAVDKVRAELAITATSADAPLSGDGEELGDVGASDVAATFGAEEVIALTETLVAVPVRTIAMGKGVKWTPELEARIAFTEGDRAKLRPSAPNVANLLAPYITDSKWACLLLFGVAVFDVVSAKLTVIQPELEAAAAVAKAKRKEAPRVVTAEAPTANAARNPDA